MSYSISTLMIRNLRDVFGENESCAGARPSTRSTPMIACSTIRARVPSVAAPRLIASQARSRLPTLTFDTSRLPSLRNRETVGWSDGIGSSW